MGRADESPAWVVTGQLPTMGVGPAGTFVEGVNVSFRTRDGVVLAVFVPNSQYTAERVRDLINEKAANAAAIHALQG